jgi:hypothetical protein
MSYDGVGEVLHVEIVKKSRRETDLEYLASGAGGILLAHSTSCG